jgi:hypothetical protein
MNMFIKALLVGVATVGSVCRAQDPGATAPSADVGGGMSKDRTAVQMAKDYMKSQKFPEGKKGDDYYVLGRADLAGGPDSPDFDQYLFFAFTEAMLDAKKNLAEMMSAEIESQVDMIQKGGSKVFDTKEDGSRSISNSAARIALTEEARKLEPEILAKLKAEGKDVNDPGVKREAEVEAFKASASKVKATASFQNAAKTIARAESAGLFAKNCFVSTKGKGDVAVVCKLTPRATEMVKAILGTGPAPTGNAKEPISDWASAAGDENLAAMFGVQPRADENGNICLVAFGQASPEEDNSVMNRQARSRAKLLAQQALRQYAGEMVTTATMANDKLSVAIMAENLKRTTSDSAFQEEVSAVAEKLSITGIQTAYQWEGDHPLSGKKTYGVVLYWNLSNSQDANQLRQLLGSLGGSKGGAGASNQLPAGKSGTGDEKKNMPRRKAIEGVPSSNDDD